jgi:subtilase family serine protease
MNQRFTVPSLLAVLLVVACVFGTAFAQDTPPLLTHHVREATLNGQAPLVGHLPATHSMRLVLVLPLRNQADLESFLGSLYDPYSPSYRQFLTVEEFTARYGPTQQDYDAVTRFAEANGLTVVGTSRNRLNVDVQGTVSNIEKALHVNLGIYQHPTESRTFYAPDREPTPALSVQLWHISGLDNYSIPHPALLHKVDASVRSNATTGSCPGASFCGSDMRAAYYEGTTLTGAGQSVGLLEYYGTDLADLKNYYKGAKQTETVPITLLSTDGTSTSCLASEDCDDTEQTLDMSQALGMAPGLSSLVMYVGSTDSAIFNAMATAKPLNAQLSSSWTWYPADPNTDNPYFEEFAAQGQNLFQASGDSGKWLGTSEIFPADDVYVTSVGGTDLETTAAAGDWKSETAWSDGSGGISPNKFAIPSWQVATAAGCKNCSQTYRNGPDVSANANFTFYVCADQTTCTENLYGGTSFAAPMWAGYLALTNQQAVANGEPTLGFINPTLYTIGLSSSYDTDFHDVTSGCQEGTGWCAATGYDLVTGLGSPNGANLINALAGTASANFALSASPSAVTIAAGASGTSTITSTVSGGFDASVALTTTLPVKYVSFSPSTIAAPGSGTSTMTIDVPATYAAGTYTLKITGTGGGKTNTTSVKVTVTK